MKSSRSRTLAPKLAGTLASGPTIAASSALVLLFATFPSSCAEHTPPQHPPEPVPSASAPVPVEGARPAPAQVPRIAPRFAIAAESASAASVARSVLLRGGSAADAAIASVLTGGVSQPVSSGIGGGGFAVVWDAKVKRAYALDFRETAPAGLRPSDYDRRKNLPEARRGVMVGVPGEVAGLAEIHARWGHLALGVDVTMAADVAEIGFPISVHMARALKWNQAWVLKTSRLSFFAPRGALATTKDTVKNPELAATLRRIAAEGPSAFYRGAIASDIVETARAAGGRVTTKDLEAYAVIERSPLHGSWEGLDVFTMPAESAGGLMILETLGMHSRAQLEGLGYGTSAYLHLLAETFRGATVDRIGTIGDPAYSKDDIARLVDPARLAARRATFSPSATTPIEKFHADEHGTSHLVVADAEGNVVSVTTTVNNMFGAKLVTRGGFVLNDELDDFSTRELERRFGVPEGRGPNSPRGGARPTSSMAPTIVVKDGKPVLALGGSGGMKIAPAVTQVLLARLAFGRDLAQAVTDPRIFTPPSGGLFIDPGVPASLIDRLARCGEVVESTEPNYSAVQAIGMVMRGDERLLEAAADPRKGGTAIVETSADSAPTAGTRAAAGR